MLIFLFSISYNAKRPLTITGNYRKLILLVSAPSGVSVLGMESQSFLLDSGAISGSKFDTFLGVKF